MGGKHEYRCIECELHYDDEDTAKQCESWCAETKSCNINITKLSVEANQAGKGENQKNRLISPWLRGSYGLAISLYIVTIDI